MAVCASGSESSGSIGKAWIVHSLLIGAAVAAAAAAAHRGFFRRLLRRHGYRSRVIGIIPARFASSRFPGKPLVQILGKPMIQRTWERAKMASTLDHVVIATDDDTIAKLCHEFGADVVMTSETCKNGTERCNEALDKLGKDYDVVVNIQGDEPLIEPEIIDGIVKALQVSPDAVFSTSVTSLKSEDATDPNRVKCIVDNNGYALYFSRGLIPYNKSGKVNPQFPYLLHLGIQVIKVDHVAHGVDTPEDVEMIEALMREMNIS